MGKTIRLVFVAAIAHAAFGGTVWNNGGPNGLGGNAMTDLWQAEDFVVSTTSNLTGITFWSLEGVPADYAGAIFWRISTNVAGLPGPTIIASGSATPVRTATGATPLGFTEFQNVFTISVLGLAPGTYWLQLHNGDPSTFNQFTDFYWETADSAPPNSGTNAGAEISLTPPGSVWTSNFAEHAFIISGDPVAIPEPVTFSLVGAGLLFAGFVRLRHRHFR